MANSDVVARLRALPTADKRLLKAFLGIALLCLGLGLIYGTLTAFARAGFLDLEEPIPYRLLSLHGVTIFFYWLYFAQAALVLTLVAVYTEGVEQVAWRPIAWWGFALMTAGLVLNQTMPVLGLAVLYDAQPELVNAEGPKAVLFYAGYSLLGLGLLLVAVAGIWTALKPRFEGKIASWSPVTFAAVAWAGLLVVSALAALNLFLPAMRWALGLSPMPAEYTMGWHVLFHNVHYLPLMAAVVLWYVLVEVMTGVKSIFGERFSKIVFSLYLIFVPPTSLYHMFLEPNLPDVVRVTGSLLSLFIGVPTVLVFLIVVVSLEVHARASGGRGLFGWLKLLPWGNPAMAAVGMAVVNLALGGALSFVLIQERLAPLLSDTFFVPGYFHFLTLGTVTLTFVAAMFYVLPALAERPLWRPQLLARMPYVITFGLLVFGAAGVTAGYMGVPRRMIYVTFEGDAPAVWGTLMTVVGVGAVFMAIGLAVYVLGLVRTLLGRPAPEALEAGWPPVVAWSDVTIGRQRAWLGALSVLVLVGAMYAFSALAFELMESLPLGVTGGGVLH
ncbi:MAG: cbb3-type cytochrome c oxidase subunit I [Alphaproteobacteria bacterium]